MSHFSWFRSHIYDKTRIYYFSSACVSLCLLHSFHFHPPGNRRNFLRPKKFIVAFLFLNIFQALTSLFSATAAWNVPTIIGGTPDVFTDVQLEANPSPGAGIIPAGLLEKEFRTVSKSDPDSHMKRLSTDCLGCSAVGEWLSLLLCPPASVTESLTAWYHDYPSRPQRPVKQTFCYHEVSPCIDFGPACPA